MKEWLKQLTRDRNLQLEVAAIGLILLLGGWIRYWWIVTIPTEQLYDFSTYYDVAVNVATGKGFTFLDQPIAFQGMLYSFMLGHFFKLMGTTSVISAKSLNIVLGMGTVILSYLIMCKLTARKGLRYAVLLITSFMPHLVAYTNTLGTETMMSTLLAGVIYLQLHGGDKRWRLPLIGILTGLCALTKPFYMAYPVVIALGQWLSGKQYKTILRDAGVVLAIMVVMIAPWTVRNYQAYGRFIPVSYNSGFVMYLNNNANNIHGGWMSLDTIHKTPDLQKKIDQHLEYGNKSVKLASDIELDFKKEAQAWIVNNPWEFGKLGVIRVHSTFFNGAWDVDSWTMNGIRSLDTGHTEIELSRSLNAFRAWNDIFYGILTAFGAVFVFLNVPRVLQCLFSFKHTMREWITIPLLNLAFPVVVYFVYEGQPRYGVHLIFLFIIVFVLQSSILLETFRRGNGIE